MATLVDLATEEDQFRELARFAESLDKVTDEQGNAIPQESFIQEVAALLKGNQVQEALSALIMRNNKVCASGKSLETEGYFAVLISLLIKTQNEPLLRQLLDEISANTSENTPLRIKVLINAFNHVPLENKDLRYTCFVKILQFSLDTKNAEMVIQKLTDLSKWIKEWSLSNFQSRLLYKLVYKNQKSVNRIIAAQSTLITFLSTFQNDDVSSVVNEAVDTVVTAIRHPEIINFDSILELDAVTNLRHATFAPLYELLTVFASEKLEAFYPLFQTHAQYYEGLGLVRDDCVRKLRLLSLASLAATQKEIPYQLVAQTLRIEVDEVESWIVTAIGLDLLEAKIDQLRQVVTVRSHFQRTFSQAEWVQLAVHLDTWRNNVRSILQVLQNTKLPTGLEAQ